MAISTIGATALDSGVSQLGKNLVQNGSFAVAQRGTSFANADGYTLDRWQQVDANATTAEATITQDTTAPSGFSYSLKIDVTATDVSIAANDLWALRQKIEAQNLQHLDYGAAGAKTVTVSFYVRSNKTGTYSGALFQPDGTRTYPFTYTVDAANTFEKKTVTIGGDASGTINADTGSGLELVFMFLGGSSRVGTADAWGAGQFYGVTGGNNLFDDAANEFYLAGVQLEVGSVATDFEHEGYGTTLAKCQRYFERISGRDTYQLAAVGVAISATQGEFVPPWLVEKRASPTISYSGNIYLRGDSGGTTYNATNVVAAFSTRDHASLTVVVASGLTIGRCYLVETGNTTSDYFQVDAEL